MRAQWVYSQAERADKRPLPKDARNSLTLQDKTIQCVAWIHNFVKKIGERLPELKQEDHKTLEIPVKNRARLFMLYQTRKFGQILVLVSRGTFYTVVDYPEFQFIRFPTKKKAFFHKCGDCMTFDGALQVAKSALDIAQARNRYTQHLLLMMKEREWYARTKMMAATTTPEQVMDCYADSTMSLIVDAMDQEDLFSLFGIRARFRVSRVIRL